jgi:hypothetical protein
MPGAAARACVSRGPPSFPPAARLLSAGRGSEAAVGGRSGLGGAGGRRRGRAVGAARPAAVARRDSPRCGEGLRASRMAPVATALTPAAAAAVPVPAATDRLGPAGEQTHVAAGGVGRRRTG